jgi:hypothetical protein
MHPPASIGQKTVIYKMSFHYLAGKKKVVRVGSLKKFCVIQKAVNAF